MGIRGLERIIRQNDGYKPNILEKTLKDFSGKYICIDTSEFIIRSLIKDKNYHVSGILNLLEKCLRNNIIPLFVFDGKSPIEKRNILNERQKRKDRAAEKLKTIDKESKDLLELNELIFKLNELQQSRQINNSNNNILNSYTNILSTNTQDIETLSTNTQDIDSVDKLKKQIISRINSSNSLVDINTQSTLSPDDSDIDNEYDITDYNDIFDFENTDKLIRSFEVKLIELSNEKKKMKKKCHNYNDTHINDIKGLLNLFDIPYIESKCESDFVCTALCKLGIVDAVLSNDMDFIVLGCPVIIRNLNFKNDNIDVYYYNNICENLGLNSNNLTEISMILGCDYCNRIINIKNKYVYNIYSKFNNLEYLANNLNNLNLYFKENTIHISKEIIEYLENEPLALDTSIDIKKIKSMFNINISLAELELLILNNIDLSKCFSKCKNTLKTIYNNDKLYYNIIEYCYNKCYGLNTTLIEKKCSIICNRIQKTTNTYNINKTTNTYNINDWSLNSNNLECQIRNDINFKCKHNNVNTLKTKIYSNNNTKYVNNTLH